MGERIHNPTHRCFLHPGSDKRYGLTCKIQPIIATSECIKCSDLHLTFPFQSSSKSISFFKGVMDLFKISISTSVQVSLSARYSQLSFSLRTCLSTAAPFAEREIIDFRLSSFEVRLLI